jgi:hypothetical protein
MLLMFKKLIILILILILLCSITYKCENFCSTTKCTSNNNCSEGLNCKNNCCQK